MLHAFTKHIRLPQPKSRKIATSCSIYFGIGRLLALIFSQRHSLYAEAATQILDELFHIERIQTGKSSRRAKTQLPNWRFVPIEKSVEWVGEGWEDV